MYIMNLAKLYWKKYKNSLVVDNKKLGTNQVNDTEQILVNRKRTTKKKVNI